MQTVKFFTLGCKVNQYDTQRIRERFFQAGFKEIDNGSRANIYVINTCTVTSSADRKSRYLIHYARRHNPKAKIIVTGCYAELDSREIAKIPGVTHIVRNQDRDKIPALLTKQRTPSKLNTRSAAGIAHFAGHTRVFLKIQDGCDNFCSYCKVPLVRSVLKSKPLDKIREETERLVKNGFKEIVLCGICLGAFGKDFKNKIDLVDAIEAIEDTQGLMRIRLSSIEASDVSDRLVRKLAKSKKMCRHLHIPLQSGDDEILKKMNRKCSRQDYLNFMQKIRNNISEVAITTDVMVGFPGENDINFKNTVDLVKEILPLKVHIFPYSPRQGTAAYDLKDRISPLEIRKRTAGLRDIAHTCSLTYQQQFLNKKMRVLIEERSQEDKDYWKGYTDNYLQVRIKSVRNLKNQIILCRLKKIFKDYILADFC